MMPFYRALPHIGTLFLLIIVCDANGISMSEQYFKSLQESLVINTTPLELGGSQVTVLPARGGFIGRDKPGYEPLSNRLFVAPKAFNKPPAKMAIDGFHEQLQSTLVLSKGIEEQADLMTLFAHAFYDTILEEEEENPEFGAILQKLREIQSFLGEQGIEFGEMEFDSLYRDISQRVFLETLLDWSDLLYYQGVDPRTLKVEESRAANLFQKVQNNVQTNDRNQFLKLLYPSRVKQNWEQKVSSRILDLKISIESGWFTQSVQSYSLKKWFEMGLDRNLFTSLVDLILEQYGFPRGMKEHHERLSGKLLKVREDLKKARDNIDSADWFSSTDHPAPDSTDPDFESIEKDQD